ncbi:MAG TPA: c-type cytochrome [Stellaceae bacterium]|nr:c-type cytochrome [Stellaceae bacterium]
MRGSRLALTLLAMGVLSAFAIPAASAGDAERGAAGFRACGACHSLKPDQNMTGPSLAGLWERKAGSLESFERYSPALKSSNIVWDEKSLDAWLKSPQGLVPQNRMVFPGIPDARQRADLIAFLKQASAGGGMQAAMGAASSGLQDLKKLGADRQVQAIRYCHDTYRVTTADGKTADFWEVNLRFKTDSSGTGPLAGKPVMMRAGMMGDRASVFFAAPEEIGTFIKSQC